MLTKYFFILLLFFTQNIFAFSTLDCTSNQNISYSSHNKTGGAAPYPGMITHIEQIKKDREIIYQIVHRAECYNDSFCQIQQPELVDIVSPNFSFNFIEDSKLLLASEGQEMDPVKKETYAIKFMLDREIWMICDSFIAFYP